MKRGQHGLTLVELMVTLAVAILLLAVGIPAFDAVVGRNAAISTVNPLVTALQLARSEAVSRGSAVRVESADWNLGWQVLAAAEVLRSYATPRPAVVAITGGVSPVTFNGYGECTTCAPATFTVTAYSDSSKSSSACVRVRDIVISPAGQIRLENKTCP
jgi:type IV fimbrial biogenesis protein FimT